MSDRGAFVIAYAACALSGWLVGIVMGWVFWYK